MMKNVFLYTFTLVAALTSCSTSDSENIAVEISDNNQQPIVMSVGAPDSEETNTRGIGTVGSTDVNTNKWNGQEVKVFMLKHGTLEKTLLPSPGDNNTFYWDTPMITPNAASGKITRTDKMNCYYPVSQVSDFWGYFADGAEQNAASVKGNQLVIPFKIDGSQDLLVGATEKSGRTLGDEYYYSAYSSRMDSEYGNPNLIFRHLLTRLEFWGVPSREEYSGDKSTVISETDILNAELSDHVYADKRSKYGLNLGVYIDAIKIQSHSKGEIIVVDLSSNKQSVVFDKNGDEDELGSWLSLKNRKNGESSLVPFTVTQVSTQNTVQLGDALLIEPRDHYSIRVKFHQYQERANVTPGQPKYVCVEDEWSKPNIIDLTKIDNTTNKSGRSYRINLQVSGTEMIILNSTLTPWIPSKEDYTKPLE